MDIEILALCDAATDTMGKLNLLGAFDSIIANATPIVHPQCTVALRIRFSRDEKGNHEVKIRLIDQDGAAIVPDLDARVNVVFRSDQTSLAMNMVMNLQHLKLEKPGEYAVDVAVDGVHQKAIPLDVRLRQTNKN